MQEVIRVQWGNGEYVIFLDDVEMCRCKDAEIAFAAIKWCWNKWLGEVESPCDTCAFYYPDSGCMGSLVEDEVEE